MKENAPVAQLSVFVKKKNIFSLLFPLDSWNNLFSCKLQLITLKLTLINLD
jgi:hypothetical protein